MTSKEAPAGVRSMAIVRWVLVAVMALVAALSVLSYFGWSGTDRGSHAHEAKQYYCPMHPQIVQDRPGNCPICGMTLVEKMQGQGQKQPAVNGPAVQSPAVAGLVPVEIPSDRVQKIGVRTEKVVRQSLVSDLRAVGVVEANERGLAQISPRFSGWIESLAVSETGQQVKKGQTLATVYSPDLLQAQQELLTAVGWGQRSSGTTAPHHGGGLEGLAADARRRLELLGIASAEIDAIVKQGKPQTAIPIRSPVSGYVIAKSAVVGMSVSPGVPLFDVADLSTVWAVAEIYESDLARVRLGQPARFEVAAYPGEKFSGKVQFVAPTVDAGSRTVRVRLEFRNRPGPGGLKLRPGMYGNVLLDLPATDGLMVSSDALIDTGDVQYLFVVKEGAKGVGRFEPRRVKTGRHLEDKVEILDGLTDGETVVTTANFLIDSESRLRAAIDGQGSAAGGSGCDAEIDASKYPDKHQACRACEVQHRGMGTMEEDCKKSISKPWR
jgi:membrane fusion protein, copper/silver efflux system